MAEKLDGQQTLADKQSISDWNTWLVKPHNSLGLATSKLPQLITLNRFLQNTDEEMASQRTIQKKRTSLRLNQRIIPLPALLTN
ncbi:hypothetical protein P4S64_07120 [Vibrio sp. M60_M31a]